MFSGFERIKKAAEEVAYINLKQETFLLHCRRRRLMNTNQPSVKRIMDEYEIFFLST